MMGKEKILPTTNDIDVQRCIQCGTTETPLWRSGPTGPKSMCNACGIRWKRHNSVKKRGRNSKKPHDVFEEEEEESLLSSPTSYNAIGSPKSEDFAPPFEEKLIVNTTDQNFSTFSGDLNKSPRSSDQEPKEEDTSFEIHSDDFEPEPIRKIARTQRKKPEIKRKPVVSKQRTPPNNHKKRNELNSDPELSPLRNNNNTNHNNNNINNNNTNNNNNNNNNNNSNSIAADPQKKRFFEHAQYEFGLFVAELRFEHEVSGLQQQVNTLQVELQKKQEKIDQLNQYINFLTSHNQLFPVLLSRKL